MDTRRRFVLALGLWLVGAASAAGQSPADAVVAQLREQGYVQFEVTRTLLGRIRVVASGPPGWREIVFSPATGEILRDYWSASGGRAAMPRVFDRTDDNRPSEGGQGRGRGRGRGGDDGDDDDDD
ncbi:hypothetical protein [Rubellimicrobium sp. CFH 75288]|uniref:hypothetical protein n=1 Tax=Rubellimicrobium sp. CFH 75288 TaxID=2697034 RepID=UPI0014131585|nr:hypothetical protein [Rubellimicrobium sp. CFH 75288]NAZ35963.1 hypothetical protein [Rubellimicrobium sp. CFH 75288]